MGNKQVKYYYKIVRHLKGKDVDVCSPHNPGYRQLVTDLEAIGRATDPASAAPLPEIEAPPAD